MRIDLNCDLGEGAGHDRDLMPLITSASIACGVHAGDAGTMAAAVALARASGVAVGAHPGFADREHFGRRERLVTPAGAGALVREQTARLRAIAAGHGVAVAHVKLHGALYNQAARDAALAAGILDAIWDGEWRPFVFVLAGSVMEAVARARDPGRVVAEVFADRAYRADGSLVPRSVPGAVIADEAAAVAQVRRMVREGVVRASDGRDVPIRAETLCLHGDGASPVEFARRLRSALAADGVVLQAPGE